MEKLREKILETAWRKGFKTIESLAEAIGMTRTGFNKMFTEKSLKLITLNKICEVLEVPYTFFSDELNSFMVHESQEAYGKKGNKKSVEVNPDKEQEYLRQLQETREEIILLQKQVIELMRKK